MFNICDYYIYLDLSEWQQFVNLFSLKCVSVSIYNGHKIDISETLVL